MESAWCQGRNPAGRTAKAGDMGRRSPIGWHRHGCRAAAVISQRNRLRLAPHDPQRRKIDEGGSEGWRGEWRCRVAARMAWNRTERSGGTQLGAIFNTLNVQCRLILCTKRESFPTKRKLLLAGAFHPYPENVTAAFPTDILLRLQCSRCVLLQITTLLCQNCGLPHSLGQSALYTLSGFKQASLYLIWNWGTC